MECPGYDDDEKCPNFELLKDNDEGLSQQDRENMFVSYDDNRICRPLIRNIPPPRDEQILELYFMRRHRQVDVAKKLSISQSCVSKIVNKYRPIIGEVIRAAVNSEKNRNIQKFSERGEFF